MRMSTRVRYALRAMIELAQNADAKPVPLEAIAKRQALSTKYLHVLLASLRDAKLLRTVRGPGGGYVLARPAQAISALDIVTAIDGPCTPVDCVARPAECDRAVDCAARTLWCEVGRAVDDVLARSSLAQLAGRQLSEACCPD